MSPLASYDCSICGAKCPKEYLKHGKFKERVRWLRHHRVLRHPFAFKMSIKKATETRSK